MMKCSHGFTLMEVLIALVILSVSLSALILAGSEMTSNLNYLTRKTIAEQVAMNVITKTRLGIISIKNKKTQQGSEEMLGASWFWRLNVEDAFDEDVLRLIVTVGDVKQAALLTMYGYTRRSLE